MAEFLKTDRFGKSTYKSTQSGNFDLYLPFIEKGLSLLNANGKLGYIAPSLWVVNEYGSGLRTAIKENRQLYGWIDFKSFQVFEEATVYTALQFYSKRPNNTVKVSFASDGVIPENPWPDKESELAYSELEFGDRWLLLTGKERKLINKLYKTCKRLDNDGITTNIFVGLQTSADAVYHLKYLSPNRYKCHPSGKGNEPYEINLEDEVMKPLVSGVDAKRYIEPRTGTYLLFPYRKEGNEVKLIDQKYFSENYPNAWAFLKSYEEVLRKREASLTEEGDFEKNEFGEIVKAPFNDNQWYRFGRHQNLDKQEISKLIVPRLVYDLHCSVDVRGEVYLDNVDVGGVAVAKDQNPYYIAGVLNAPVANFVFQRISKPFRGEYKSANKQFIAPIPIPNAKKRERGAVANHAETLQNYYTRRRNIVEELSKRLNTAKLKSRPITFLFPTLKQALDYSDELPLNLKDAEKKALAKQKYEEGLQSHYDEITARLHPTVKLSSTFIKGEIRFSLDGIPIVENIFLDEKEGALILAQWKVLAQTYSITEKTDGKKICNTLRKLATTDNLALVDQIINLENDLSSLEEKIKQEEEAIDNLLFKLYGLTQKEIELVKQETK